MRSIKKVIKRISKSIDMLDHVGYGIQPIAVAADPDDDIDADYTVQICFHTDLGDDKFYIQLFQAYIRMDTFMTMSEARFKNNLTELRINAINWRDRDCKDGRVVTKDGITDMATIISKAQKSFDH